MMSALDMSEEFFNNIALPSLKENFPQHWDRIGAGLMGNGSECLGFDDDLSGDHDWGIEFFMWLTPEDFEAIGQDVINWKTKLMSENKDQPFRVLSDYGVRTTVMTPGMFFKQLIGLDRCPQTIMEWRRAPESNLVMVTNGRIFTDPMGEMTKIREEILAYYPEDLRLKKIAARCMSIAQTGQYNYLRMAQRGEHVTCEIILAKFIQDVVSMVFMLNKRFMPYYKWSYRAMRDLPILAPEISELIEKLYSGEAIDGAISSGNVIKHDITELDKNRAAIVEQICALIAAELRKQRISGSYSTFLVQHGEDVQRKIKDPQLASLPTQYE